MSTALAGHGERFQTRYFCPADVAFALAWAVYAPGLGGWTVEADLGETGVALLLVDPPLVYGDGFRISLDGDETVISWASEELRVATLRQAMLLICPLSPNALAAVEALTAGSEPTL